MSVRIVGRCAVTKESDRLAGVLSTTKENSVGALGTAESKLIQSDALTTGLDNSGSDSLSESQSSNGKLRDIQKAGVVSDGTDDHGGLAFLALQVSRQSGDGDRRIINFGHSQSLDNRGSEFGLRASGQEAVKNNVKKN